MKAQSFKNLEKFFDASDEGLLRSTHEGVLEEHLSHYTSRLTEFFLTNDVNSVLDFGCGDGRVLDAFAKKYPDTNFVGVDLSPANISLAREKYSSSNVSYYQVAGGVEDISHLGSFDLIFSFSVVQYFDVPSMEILIRQLKDLLNPQGTLVHMSIPDFKHYFRALVSDSASVISFLKSSVRLFLALFDRNQNYGTNGFWWSRDLLMTLHKKDYKSVCCLSSDSWYRFDLICSNAK